MLVRQILDLRWIPVLGPSDNSRTTEFDRDQYDQSSKKASKEGGNFKKRINVE